MTEMTYRGFTFKLSEPFTPEQEVAMKKFVDHIIKEREKSKKNIHKCEGVAP